MACALIDQGARRSPTSRLLPVRPDARRSSNWTDPRLRGAEMGEVASVISGYQPVRDALLGLPAPVRRPARRRRPRRARHRNGGVPACRCEAVHHGGAGGAGPPAAPASSSGGARTRITRRSSPTSVGVTSATCNRSTAPLKAADRRRHPRHDPSGRGRAFAAALAICAGALPRESANHKLTLRQAREAATLPEPVRLRRGDNDGLARPSPVWWQAHSRS